jgi:hypothetical protein
MQQGGDHGDGGILPASEPLQGVPFVVADVNVREWREQRVHPVDAPTVPPLLDSLVLPLFPSDVALVVGRAHAQRCAGNRSMRRLVIMPTSVPSHRYAATLCLGSLKGRITLASPGMIAVIAREIVD